MEMGYTDFNKNKTLVEKHRGDVNQVVMDLLV